MSEKDADGKIRSVQQTRLTHLFIHVLVRRHGHSKAPPLAASAPQLGSCSNASSVRAWRLWAARYSQSEALATGRPASRFHWL